MKVLVNADQEERRGLALLESVRGAEHPEIATALANIADLYREMKKHGDAIALLARAEAILRDFPNADVPYDPKAFGWEK